MIDPILYLYMISGIGRFYILITFSQDDDNDYGERYIHNLDYAYLAE